MKSISDFYVRELVRAGVDLNFSTAVNTYGKFTIYCLIGPRENILHLTFSPAKHETARKILSGADSSIVIRSISQEDFSYNEAFSGYFIWEKPLPPFKVDSPFISRGTRFQQRVWHQISRIPYGSRITYQRLAELAGSPGGARAAGAACGANPLSIIIPCHRVTASHGLGGFAGGLAVKKSLLALEQGAGSCNF